MEGILAESTKKEWEALEGMAPKKPEGIPSQEQIAHLRAHKVRVKEFLGKLSEEERTLLVAPTKKKGSTKQNGGDRQNHRGMRGNQTISVRHRTDRKKDVDVDYLCILDFEATCNDGPAPTPQEIIEFPTLLMNTRSTNVESEFHTYIKPDVHPELSAFCTELTGITQQMVDAGVSLEQALGQHKKWLLDRKLIDQRGKNFLYVTCGDWDLKSCLPRQLHHHGKSVPDPFCRWINVKLEFSRFYGVRPKGMIHMLTLLDLELEGRHHSGIDDCRNIARICKRMLNDGWNPEETSKSFF